MEMQEMHEKLSAPFPGKTVKWRAGELTSDGTMATALAYIEARDVMDRLDEVVGPENWEDVYQVTRLSDGRAVVTCSLTLQIDGRLVTKTDGTDVDLLSEKGFEHGKSAMSEAFKRVAVKWGIGRYLYRLDAPWMPVDDQGQIEHRPRLPDWALPKDEQGKSEPSSQPAPAATSTKVTPIDQKVRTYLDKVAQSVNVSGLVAAYTTADQHFGEAGGTLLRAAVLQRYSDLANSCEDMDVLAALDANAAKVFDENQLLVIKERLACRMVSLQAAA